MKDQSVRMGVLLRVVAWRTARKWVVLRGWMEREMFVGEVTPTEWMFEIGELEVVRFSVEELKRYDIEVICGESVDEMSVDDGLSTVSAVEVPESTVCVASTDETSPTDVGSPVVSVM